MTNEKPTEQPYEPTPPEAKGIISFYTRLKSKLPAPTLKVRVEDGKNEVSIDHKDQNMGWTLFMESLNTTDIEFAKGIVNNLVNSHGK